MITFHFLVVKFFIFIEIILCETKHLLQLFIHSLCKFLFKKAKLGVITQENVRSQQSFFSMVTKIVNLVHGWFVCITVSKHSQCRKHSSQQKIHCFPKLIALNALNCQCCLWIVGQRCKIGNRDYGQLPKEPFLTEQMVDGIVPSGKPCPCLYQETNRFPIVHCWCLNHESCMYPMVCTRPKHIVQSAGFQNKGLKRC